MSRDIEFRAKNNLGEWVYGYVAVVELWSGFSVWKIFNADNSKEGTPIDPKTLGQYTGVKDKRDFKIYEGDVVTAWIETTPNYYNPDDNIHLVKGEVFLDVGCFLFGDGYYLDGDHIWGLEIIGNIHDKPELLEK